MNKQIKYSATFSLLIMLAVSLTFSGTAFGVARSSHISWLPELGRRIVPTRAIALGPQLATWYGPGLFGNGTACGKKLTEKTWGIAHRSLPCGTLVTVSHKHRKVSVRVIDRGPFSGATVDLTSRTKHYLRFTSGSVRLTQIRKYRVLPRLRHHPR